MAGRKNESEIVEIAQVEVARVGFVIIGTSPLILNRMSEKVRRELLLPKGRKTAAEKQSSLKHDPVAEYKASPYVLPDGPAALAVMSSAIKGAMMTAALDTPGAKKAQIGRLVHVEGEYTPIYGVPRLFMSVTRSADMNRTPDIRTRAIVPRWAAVISILYTAPILNKTTVANLLSAGGVTSGIGDWRPEKGKGGYGQFEVTSMDDPRVQAIIAEGGREAQLAALADPQPYDRDSADLLAWYTDEVMRRGAK